MREKEEDTPRARSQTVVSQIWRQKESKIYIRKEKFKNSQGKT